MGKDVNQGKKSTGISIRKGIPSYIEGYKNNPPKGYSYRDIMKHIIEHPGKTVGEIKDGMKLKLEGPIYNQILKMRSWGMISRSKNKPYQHYISEWGQKYAKDKGII